MVCGRAGRTTGLSGSSGGQVSPPALDPQINPLRRPAAVTAPQCTPPHATGSVGVRLQPQPHSHRPAVHVPEQHSLLSVQMLPLAMQQELLEQVCPGWHIWPQPPQFWRSEVVSAHVPLHSV